MVQPDRWVGPVVQDKVLTDSSSHHVNGMNGTNLRRCSRDPRVLDSYDDEYVGVVVNPNRLQSKPNDFVRMLRSSLSQWKIQGKKGVWLKLPLELSELVPIAVKEGFQYHHAERGHVILTYWLPEGPCMLPANASLGSFVLNGKNEILIVQERYCTPAFMSLWKLPTGFIQESEEIYDGAVIEVKEETGIDTQFVEVIVFRHAHHIAFDGLVRHLHVKPTFYTYFSRQSRDPSCKEFVAQPPIQGDRMFKKIIDICLARLGRSYCGLFPHKVISGKESTLYYNFIQAEDDSNCRTVRS